MNQPASTTRLTSVARHSGPVELQQSLHQILRASRAHLQQSINATMVQTYWHVGRLIVECQKSAQVRGQSQDVLDAEWIAQLNTEFGDGLSAQCLLEYRQLYLYFPSLILVKKNLQWAHYRILLQIDSPHIRNWYMQQATDHGWSVRALEQQIAAHYYERWYSAREKLKAKVKAQAALHIAQNTPHDPTELMRDPHVLEFLGASAQPMPASKGLNQQMS